MENIIFSVYLPNRDPEPRVAHRKYNDTYRLNAYETHYKKLIDSKRDYAKSIGCKFEMFQSLGGFETKMKITHLSKFDQINFYKLYLMEELAKTYDNILYLDFDVIPTTTENFFDTHDMSVGIHVKSSIPHDVDKVVAKRTRPSIRSPFAKYWNLHCMQNLSFIDCEVTVFNTGIVGSNAEFIKDLDYFGDFENDLKLMEQCKTDEMYPMRDCFGTDNETLFGYKVAKNKIPWSTLDDRWHHIYDLEPLGEANFVHVINKRFEDVDLPSTI